MLVSTFPATVPESTVKIRDVSSSRTFVGKFLRLLNVAWHLIVARCGEGARYAEDENLATKCTGIHGGGSNVVLLHHSRGDLGAFFEGGGDHALHGSRRLVDYGGSHGEVSFSRYLLVVVKLFLLPRDGTASMIYARDAGKDP